MSSSPHPPAQAGMDKYDDTDLLSAEFGQHFYGKSTFKGDGEYEVKYIALRQGSYKMFVKLGGINIQGSPFTLEGESLAITVS
jgi:hypothetical protein